MRICCLVLVFVAGLSACASNQGAPDRPALIERLTDIKLNEWPSYYKNQDADGLAEFLSPDFVFITNSGERSTYDEEVQWVRNNPWSGDANDDFIYRIEDIFFQSDTVVIIYGEGTSTRTDENGLPCAHSYWSSNTLRRENGRWKPTFSHVSGAKCVPVTSGARPSAN